MRCRACFIDQLVHAVPVIVLAGAVVPRRALRVVTLGRKNFMLVGHVEAGQNLAVLYTLVATCELHGINPLAYLTDMLPRVQHTRASQLSELLPWNWQTTDGNASVQAPPELVCG